MRAAAILCAFLLCNIMGPSLGDVNSSLKKAFSFITQLLSVDEKSAVFPFFSLLQRKLLQLPQAPAKVGWNTAILKNQSVIISIDVDFFRSV